MKKFLAALLLMVGINALADDINLWQKSSSESLKTTNMQFHGEASIGCLKIDSISIY